MPESEVSRMEQSEKLSLNHRDIQQWAYNIFVFLVPALLVVVASLEQIIPTSAQYGALALFLCNAITDLLRKYLKGGTIPSPEQPAQVS